MKKKFDKAKQTASRLIVKFNPGRRSRSRSPNPADSDPDPNSLAPAASIGKHDYADPRAPQSALETAGSVANEFLAAARDGADLCLPLKAALVGAVKIFEICERTVAVSEQYKDLKSRVAHLGAVTGALSKRSHLDANLMQRLDNIAESFSRLQACIEAKEARGAVRRVLESQADVAEIKELLVKISARIEAFIYESVVRVQIGVDAILARLPTAEENELERELEKWNAIAKVIQSGLGGELVHAAAHDAQPADDGCMPGTRVGVLSKFVDWVENDPKNIFWLAGMAGTGKTSIAITICRMLSEDSDVLLGGTFFCSRTTGDEARADARRIIPTLAATLAKLSPRFASELAAELKQDTGTAAHRPTSEQMGPLLQRPLAALASSPRPIVFVIDALDECSNERELAELLKAIANFKGPTKVKFILTSRPETHILGSPISDRAHNEILQLHTVGAEDVTEDIRMYIDHNFSQHPLDPAETWYTQADARVLASLANGLFIFASTVIAYILDTDAFDDRQARLRTALHTMKDSKVATGPLDEVYEFVLTRASNTAKVEPEELARTQQVLACILEARMPMSLNTLAELLGRRADAVRSSLRRLRAVVHVPDELNHPGLRTLHASFGDYLFDRAAPGIRIVRSDGNDALARGCLQVMVKRLHFNVSQSRSSYQPNPSEKPDFIVHSLEYACLQWIYHVSGLPHPSSLDDLIYLLFRPRILFWLEVMSVLGYVGRAAAILMIAVGTAQSIGLIRFLRDANQFVASSREAIERSAPHIYISALSLSAKDSLIYQTFYPMCIGTVFVEAFGIDRHGGRLVMTIGQQKDDISTAAYSQDGRRIVSCSSGATIRIWDTLTGDEISSIQTDDGDLNSVEFSPNGQSLVSGTSTGVVCVWTLSTSQASPRRSLGHSDRVVSVMFSPDGSLIASGSADKTVRLWSTETGDLRTVMRGHTRAVRTLSFSRSSDLLASGSDDTTVRLWNATTGLAVGGLLRGHTKSVMCISFSPDGTTLVSCSGEEDILLWDVRTGETISRMRGHTGAVTSVRFAPDGRSLVSVGSDMVIRLWTQQLNTTEYSHSILVRQNGSSNSVGFSPDGSRVFSVSRKLGVRIWDFGDNPPAVQPLPCHEGTVNSVAVSPDCAAIISGSHDQSVRVWDARTGDEQLPPLIGHTQAVSSVAVSSTGDLIASGSHDCSVRLWDLKTGVMVGEPLLGHDRPILTVAFSPDGRYLASGSDDSVIYIWDVATRQPSSFGSLRCNSSVNSLSFSPDNMSVTAGEEGGHIYTWHTETGQLVQAPLQAHNGSIEAIALSSNGTHLAAAGAHDRTVSVWDVTTRQKVYVLEGHTEGLYSVAFSINSQLFVSGSLDCTIRLWDATTFTQICALYGQGEHNTVCSTLFTPDCRSIVSSSSNQTIRVWDVEAATTMQASHDRLDPVAALAFTELVDGWLIGSSGELLLWIPADYRDYLLVPPCRTLIAQHRVVISNDGGVLHAGNNWSRCWSNVVRT